MDKGLVVVVYCAFVGNMLFKSLMLLLLEMYLNNNQPVKRCVNNSCGAMENNTRKRLIVCRCLVSSHHHICTKQPSSIPTQSGSPFLRCSALLLPRIVMNFSSSVPNLPSPAAYNSCNGRHTLEATHSLMNGLVPPPKQHKKTHLSVWGMREAIWMSCLFTC